MGTPVPTASLAKVTRRRLGCLVSLDFSWNVIGVRIRLPQPIMKKLFSLIVAFAVVGCGRETPVWQRRERTEREAASLFAHLAVMLNNLNLPPALVQLAARASKEEASHALDCRRIIQATGIGLEK